MDKRSVNPVADTILARNSKKGASELKFTGVIQEIHCLKRGTYITVEANGESREFKVPVGSSIIGRIVTVLYTYDNRGRLSVFEMVYPNRDEFDQYNSRPMQGGNRR
jgi:hypothetical protein